MDLKDPDISKVKLAGLNAGGTAPASFLLGAALTPAIVVDTPKRVADWSPEAIDGMLIALRSGIASSRV